MTPTTWMIERPQQWQDDAECATVAADVFFPEVGGQALLAKAICAMCPVAEQCLEYALTNREEHGIWAGTTGKERKRMSAATRANEKGGDPIAVV